MKKQTPLQQIEDLFQFCDAGKLGDLKSGLTNLKSAVSALQDKSGLSDITAQNKALESALEAEKKDSTARLESAKAECAAQIEILRSELDAFQKEKAEREDKEIYNLPSEQIEVLRALQPPEVEKRTVSDAQFNIGVMRVGSDPYHSMQQILNAMPHADEIVLHLQNLERLKLVERGVNSIGKEAWFRTRSGNERIIAERLARE